MCEGLLRSSIIISYGDIVYSPEILKRLISTPGELVIAIDENWENYWKVDTRIRYQI